MLFVDQGSYHHETLSVPAAVLARHERVTDALREDADVLKRIHVDVARLCAAWLEEEG
jgi:hypothetical protein